MENSFLTDADEEKIRAWRHEMDKESGISLKKDPLTFTGLCIFVGGIIWGIHTLAS